VETKTTPAEDDHLPANWAEGRGFLPSGAAKRRLTGADPQPA
jgi:hypothetical protein